jgi:NAD(P)-dependent dehydrogenase (short-subunit alcohol dehydrogenase family)
VYGATKWALEGLSESLAKEVAEFGVKVTMIEPGSYDTDWRTSSAKHGTKMAAYDGLRARMAPMLASRVLGNPAATATAVLAVVDSDNPPLRLLLGATALKAVEQCYADRLATWKAWEQVSKDAQG